MIVLGIFLAIASYMDIKYREISILLCIIFMVMGLGMGIAECICQAECICKAGCIKQMIISTIPGVIMLFVSKVTNQGIGMGDGTVAIAIGVLLGYEKTVLALLVGFMIAGVISIILLVFKKATKSYELPFIPLLSVAVVLVTGGAG